jgi:hypothetical protein
MTTITTTLRGEYNIVVKHADGTETETGWFKNLILNSGLNLLGSSSDPIKFARVGTGNSTPVVTQTSLDAQIASTTSPITQATSRVNSGSPLYETLFTNTFAFAQGAVVGNITEVGIGWATSGSTLFSRALILDNLGFPTTLTLVALDQLTVFYRLNLTPSVSDSTGSVTLNAIPYTYTCRAASIASFASNIGTFQTSGDGFSNAYVNIYTYPAGSVLGPVTGIPTGTGLFQQPTLSNITYSAGTFYRDSTWTWGPSLANHAGGLQSIQFVWGLNGYYTYQLRFDTPVPKTNTTTLVLQMRFAWNRV